MPKSFTQELGERLASVESRLSSLSSGNRLDHASLDGTTLYLRDYDGNLSGRLGRQPDGSNGVHVVRVQPPPQLTAAILTAGEQAGTCLCEWDGGTFDGRRMPLIHGHTEIWAAQVGAEWEPTVAPPDGARRVGTIRDRTGGEVVIALPQAGVWAVWLRAMGADRETAGPWSPVATVEITPLVDTGAIEAELDQARQDIQEADQRLTAGQNTLTGHLETLNDVRLPALEQDISNAVSEATADIQDFENRWDAQWDDTIPALSSRQDTLEGEITDGLTQVHNQAEAMAEAARDDAVSMAAADAQSEYDRLQEIAERALSRAGDNVLEDPSFETDLWVNEWDGIGGFSVSRSTISPRTGDYQLRAEGVGSGDFDFTSVDVEPAMSYRLGVYWATLAYGTTGNTGWLVFKDTDTGADLAVSEPMGTSGYWSRVHVMLQVPEGTMSVTPAIRADHADAATLILEDASLREVGAAAEALRAAEQARHEAQQAHEAAGDAADAAATAYDAASSKNTIHWSLSAPSGTADSTDDIWWQYELRDGRRVVIGQWFWDDGVWRETEIAEEWLPQVNIGTGTYGDMSGDRLEANTVTTRHLAVGDFTNLFPEEALEDLRDNGVASPVWSDMAEGANGFTTLANQGGMPVVLRWDGPVPENSGTARLQFAPGGEGMAVRPGETVILSGYGWRAAGDPGNVGVRFAYRDADGGHVSWGDSFTGHIFEAGWNEFEFIETVPDVDAIRLLTVDFYGQTDSNRGHWGNFNLRQMVDGKMVVDGSLQARHVDMVDFTADAGFIDNAFVNLIQGRMANFDEALIGGTLIKDQSIGVRQIAVGDMENYFPEDATYDFRDNGFTAQWTAHTQSANGWTTLTDQAGMPVVLRWDGPVPENSGTSRLGFFQSGTGMAVRPGDRIRLSWYGWRATGEPGDVGVRFAFRAEDGSWVAYSSSVSFKSSFVEDELVATVPSDSSIRWASVDFYGDPDSPRGHWGNFVWRRQQPGKVIIDGLLQATTGELEELFFDEAVGNAIWADAVRSRLVESQGIITEDMIATGAITTPKLTVTEELVGEVAKLIRIEAGSLASNDIESMRIVSSLIEATTYLIHDADGEVSVRLDGVANYIAGRLRAGMSENSSISLDYGEKVRFSGLNEEGEPDPQRVISTPYLNFHTTNVTYQENQEPSIHLERGSVNADGMMIINPGYPEGTPPFRGLLNVVGDVRSNRVEAREWSRANYGFAIPHDDDNFTTVLGREGDTNNTYLLGRHHGASQTRARDSFWSSDQYELASGGVRRRVFTWGAPPPTGVRWPILSVHVSQGSSDRNGYVVASSSHISNTGYYINEYNPSVARATYWIHQLAVWTD